MSCLYLGTKCLTDSQAVFLSLINFWNFLLVVVELFSVSVGPPSFLFIPAPMACQAPCPSGLALGGPVSSYLLLWGLHEDRPLAVGSNIRLKSTLSPSLAANLTLITDIPLSSGIVLLRSGDPLAN